MKLIKCAIFIAVLICILGCSDNCREYEDCIRKEADDKLSWFENEQNFHVSGYAISGLKKRKVNDDVTEFYADVVYTPVGGEDYYLVDDTYLDRPYVEHSGYCWRECFRYVRNQWLKEDVFNPYIELSTFLCGTYSFVCKITPVDINDPSVSKYVSFKVKGVVFHTDRQELNGADCKFDYQGFPYDIRLFDTEHLSEFKKTVGGIFLMTDRQGNYRHEENVFFEMYTNAVKNVDKVVEALQCLDGIYQWCHFKKTPYSELSQIAKGDVPMPEPFSDYDAKMQDEIREEAKKIVAQIDVITQLMRIGLGYNLFGVGVECNVRRYDSL